MWYVTFGQVIYWPFVVIAIKIGVWENGCETKKEERKKKKSTSTTTKKT